MNTAQLNGMREMWDGVTSVCKSTKTAKEMALTPHTLNRDGTLATLQDGTVWVWNTRIEKWSMWKA